MNQHAQQEAKRDISSVNFIVTLTGLEIDTILTAVGVTTSMWAKNRRQMPGSFDLASLSSGCDKLTNPVEEDYQQRCASHSDYQSERDTCPQNKIWQHCPAAEQIRKDERDKVLDEFIDIGNSCGYCDLLDNCPIVIKIEELRRVNHELRNLRY
jgi:hypothetical protein